MNEAARPARTDVDAGADAPITDPEAARFDTLSVEEALARLRTRPEGLSEDEVRRRLERFGPNALETAKPTSAWKILVDQVKSLIVLLLFAAAVVALFMGDPLDAAAIGAVLVINTVIGFATELRARRAMEALLRYQVPQATVIRDGEERTVDAQELVPGDIVVLEAGQVVPADARLVRSTELRTDEAALTGESLPVGKRSDTVMDPDAPLPDRDNMLYKGTTVVSGRGLAAVTATGMATELGRIGGLVSGIEEEKTPLEHRLDELGHRLVWVTLGVTAVVVGLGLLRGVPLGLMLETGIALAIAAVPEGLPAVATIALAVGIRRMARRRALVRRLPSVEALGSATVICTDKTGTLTAGQMTVTTFWTYDQEVRVTGVGYEPEGEFEANGRAIVPGDDPVLSYALRIGLLANRGDIVRADAAWQSRGDPTDAALVAAARKAGLTRPALLDELPEVGEIPFSSERKLMATFHEAEGGRVAYVKGAPGTIVSLCQRYLTAEGEKPLTDAARETILEKNRELASRGLRVLALAYGPAPAATGAGAELGGLTFVALTGMIDPPAPGVKETIQTFRDAGIRTVMITGDQRLTAEAIARTLGVIEPGEEVMDGREFERLSPEERRARIADVGVFSRISPEDKLDIVSAFQTRGEIVAMLGDGVNDAAALKKSNIGVAMGIRGTDVAKEAASVVLQDDRFQTIGAAVEEGRVIFDNIRKFVFYLFSCNLAEVLVLLGASTAGLPLPLLPLQILWLNLVTDTFPALALALEPAEPGIMKQPPRNPQAAILSLRFLRSIAFYAALITVVVLVIFIRGLSQEAIELNHAVTLSFMTLALAQIFHLGNARSGLPMLSFKRATSNPYAVGAVVLTLGLQLLAVYFPPLSRVLDTSPLSVQDWLFAGGLALVPAAIGQGIRIVQLVRSRKEREG